MIESGFEKEQRERAEMFARWDVDSALFKAGIGKTRKEDIALVNAAQNKYNSLVDGGIKRGNLGLRAGLGERELDIENQRTGILKQEANAQTMNAETNRLGAITGLSSGLGQPRQQRQTLPGFSSIAPSRLQTSSPFARQRTAGVEAASESEIEDDVDPMRPRAYKNGGVIGNVKKDDGSDKVPVVAREGEYYINPETVAHIGGGDYKQGLRSLNALVREATGKEPGPSPVGKSGLRGFNKGGFVDDFGDVTLGNRKLPFAAQQAVSEAATSPLGKRVIANQFAAPQAEAVAQAAKQAPLQDISAQVREAAGRRTPIDELMNPKARGVQAPIRGDAAPKAGRVIGSANRFARFAGPIGAVSGIATDVAPVANEHGVLSNETATQFAETSAKAAGGGLGAMAGAKIGAGLGAMTGPFAPVAAPVLGLAGGAAGYYLGDKGIENVIEGGRRLLGLNPDSPREQMPREQMPPEQGAPRIEPGRSQADEYSDSPERAAWLASLGNGQPTSSQPETADDFRTRNAAADVYRREWQRQSPGGLRNANSDALTLYNAEQQVRGTGISAQRQANGVMEFSGSGPAPKAQYLDAGGTPTNEWQDTSQYRDAVVRSLGSSDPAMQQRGLAQAMQLQQRNQRGVSTGNPEMDQLLGQMDPREAAAVYRALNGGQGADGKGPKAAPYAEQQKRVIDALGEEGAAKAMPEIQQAQMQMARQLIQSGQATPEQAEAAVQNPQFITRLTNAYKLREFLAQNGQWGEAASGAGGWGTAAGLAAGGLTLGLTRNPGVAAKAAAAGGALGAGIGGAQGFTQGAQGFDAEMPLTGLMDITPLPDGDYQIGNAVIPKAMVQKNYQLFGLTAPPK